MLELLAVGRRTVRRILLAEDQDPSPQLDRIEELAARAAGPGRDGAPRPARCPGPHRVAPGRRWRWPARSSRSRSRTCAAPDRRRHRAVPPGGGRHHRPPQPGRAPAQRRVRRRRPASCCPRHRSARLSPTVTKTAAGAIEHLPFAVVGGVPAALSELRELGVWSIGLAGEADQSLYDLPLGDGPVALVVGSEEKGLAPLVRRRCDAVAAIPQHGALPSLNVGVAGAVACFEVARQRALARSTRRIRRVRLPAARRPPCRRTRHRGPQRRRPRSHDASTWPDEGEFVVRVTGHGPVTSVHQMVMMDAQQTQIVEICRTAVRFPTFDVMGVRERHVHTARGSGNVDLSAAPRGVEGRLDRGGSAPRTSSVPRRRRPPTRWWRRRRAVARWPR